MGDSCEQLRDYFWTFLDTCEAVVEAGVAVGELVVIEAEQVQDGGVEIADVDGIFGGGEAKLIRGTVDVAAPTSSLIGSTRPSASVAAQVSGIVSRSSAA
jgi:hypothetical protein